MRKYGVFVPAMLTIVFYPGEAHAMHIMEGFLPLNWSVFWTLAFLPFFIAGLRSIHKAVDEKPGLKMLLGLAGAFAFLLSALKLPSVTGSSSHMTGVGLGTILFGPVAMSVLGSIVLAFQALLLAHGGITTLGANAFSMAVAGPVLAYGIYRLMQKSGLPASMAVFTGAALGDLATYLMTSLQLALAFPAETGGFAASFIKFTAVFALTQIPLAVCEGLLTVMVFNFLNSHCRQELLDLAVIRKGAV